MPRSNYRTTCTPTAGFFFTNPCAGIQWYAFRLEAVITVIKNVLGRTFSAVEIQRMVDESSWATRGKAQFYDIMTNSWPIANTVHDDVTNANTLVPLTEDELLVNQVKDMKCIFVRQSKFKEIVQSVERGAAVDTAYELIEIESANPDVEGKYNFYQAVSGESGEGWFGYRALTHTTFGKYCGAVNEMRVGSSTTELEFLREVYEANKDAGFPPIEQLYQPASLLEFYGYSFPAIDSLPPGLKMLPFNMRNEEGDQLVDYQFPPWYDSYYSNGIMLGYGELFDKGTVSYNEWRFRPGASGMRDAEEDFSLRSGGSPARRDRASDTDSPQRPISGTHISPRRPARRRDDDEQSSGSGGPSPNRRNPGSNPLGDATLGLNNSPNGPSADGERPLKRRRAHGGSRFVIGEAEDEDGDDEEVRNGGTSNTRYLKTPQPRNRPNGQTPFSGQG